MACALILGLGGVNARTWTADLNAINADAANSEYNQETHVLTWKAPWSNSALVDGLSGDLSIYDSFTIDATIGEKTEGYRLLFYEKGNANAVQVHITTSGVCTKTLQEAGLTTSFLENFDYLRVSGLGNSGSVTLNSLSFTGPDVITYNPVILYPQNGTDVAKIISGVGYPQEFAVQGKNWGNNGLSTTGGDVSGFESISFIVSQGSTQGLSLRIWVTDGTETATLYAHPESDYKTADFTKPFLIKEAGIYSVKLDTWTMLSGIKADNDWGASPIVVDYAFATPPGAVKYAIDEARTFSSSKILDFSTVTDADAYIAKGIADNKVIMKKVTGAVPANTGLVLIQKNDKAVISIPTYGEVTEDVTDNLLVPTTTQTDVPVGAYVLAGSQQTLGWYSVAGVIPTLPAGKCYLNAPQAGVKSLVMSFDEETTGIAEAEVQREDAVYHNLQGMRVSKPTTGIFITRGKKVIINK